MRVCYRCLVSGHVQGVFYRQSTCNKALELGLSGRAVNLSNGQVEVHVCGEEAAVQALIDWLWQGPELARVSEVQQEPMADTAFEGFTTG